MYKIMSNNTVVDVVKNIHYFRILDSGHIAYTDQTSSEGFMGSDGITLYSFDSGTLELHSNVKQGYLVKIEESEYDSLIERLKSDTQSKTQDKLTTAKETKIAEMSLRCNEAIVNGVAVVLQDGKEHHFRMTVEDQLNLLFADRAVTRGEAYIMYHETDSTCRLFSAEDMKHIIDTTNKHRQYHTTYFNLLKHCINTMNTVEEINKVVYGVDLQSVGLSSEVTVLLSGV